MRVKQSQLLFVGVVGVVMLVIYYSFSGEQINTAYLTDISAFRKDKDKRFKTADDSPLDKKQRLVFDSLRYYPPNPAMRLKAKLTRLETNEVVELPTTKQGDSQKYIRWAKASFQLEGKKHEMILFKPYDQVNKKTLHLFFKDQSANTSTYEGGRYVDIEPGKTTCMIDFNMAYNPYCAYNDFYICPVPPKENYLDVSILAGEKRPPVGLKKEN